MACEKGIFLVAYLQQLLILGCQLLLFGFHQFALCTLEGCIFPYKAQSAIHLGKTTCAEDEHEFVLDATVASHIAHRGDEFLASFGQLFL